MHMKYSVHTADHAKLHLVDGFSMIEVNVSDNIEGTEYLRCADSLTF